MINIRTDHNVRLQAFELLQKLREDKVSRYEIVNRIHDKFGISIGTMYEWYRGKYVPYGRKGKLIWTPKLFYVLGALLGDGCIYKWRVTRNYVILVGDKLFTTKYSDMLEPCISKKDKPYIIRSKNVWFVRSNNFELYSFFKKARENLDYLEGLLMQSNRHSKLLFVEGFFDAEGCVKIIKEKIRRTPKICLDITNTNLRFLEIISKLLKEQLNIEARFSIQTYKNKKKKTTYHLRIYKKEYIKQFLKNVDTTKLKKEKVIYVKNWLRAKKSAI
jgi:hypothetical protein